MMAFALKKFVALFDRPEADRQRLARGEGVLGKALLFGALFAGVLALYVPNFYFEALGWQKLRTDIPLTGEDGWRVFYGDDSGACGRELARSPDCPADA